MPFLVPAQFSSSPRVFPVIFFLLSKTTWNLKLPTSFSCSSSPGKMFSNVDSWKSSLYSLRERTYLHSRFLSASHLKYSPSCGGIRFQRRKGNEEKAMIPDLIPCGASGTFKSLESPDPRGPESLWRECWVGGGSPLTVSAQQEARGDSRTAAPN